MATSEYFRLLDPLALVANQTQDRDQVIDVGSYTEMQVNFRVLKAGSAGNLQLQHAAVNEEDAWLDLGSPNSLSGTTNVVISISTFLRYVRWTTDGAVAGAPVALVDIIAKG